MPFLFNAQLQYLPHRPRVFTSNLRRSSNEAWEKNVGHLLLVSFPAFTIFLMAEVIVACRAVNQQHRKIDRIEIRHHCASTSCQTPRPCQKPITRVVNLSSKAPPTRDQQLCG